MNQDGMFKLRINTHQEGGENIKSLFFTMTLRSNSSYVVSVRQKREVLVVLRGKG